MWAIRALIIALIVIAIVAFFSYNIGTAQKVDVDLVWVKYWDVPLVIVTFWAFVAGVLVSLTLFISVYIKLSVSNHSARKKVKALESEVAVLRNRPIEESAQLISEGKESQPEDKPVFDEDK